eukprot:9493426-Pyramimonas_sp.AAC.1
MVVLGGRGWEEEWYEQQHLDATNDPLGRLRVLISSRLPTPSSQPDACLPDFFSGAHKGGGRAS